MHPLEPILLPAAYFVLMAVFLLAGLGGSRLPFYRAHIDAAFADARLNLPLESLRGLLALSVLIHHATCEYDLILNDHWDYPPSRLYTELASGPVLMFFFLSGYLFWSKLIARPAFPSRAELRTFYLRRLRRVYPLEITAIGLILLVVAWRSGFSLAEPAARVADEVFQWLTFRDGGDINGVAKSWTLGLMIFWSLRHEVRFYLVLPFLGWFARGWRFLILFGAMACLELVASRLHLERWLGSLADFPHFFVLGFSGGIVTATALARGYSAARWPAPVQWLVVVVPLVLAGFVVDLAPYTRREVALLLPPFFVVASGFTGFGLLRSRAAIFLGKISYSVYVLHGVAFYAALRAIDVVLPIRALSPSAYWAVAGGLGLLVIGLSSLTYRFVEHAFIANNSLAAAPPAAAEDVRKSA